MHVLDAYPSKYLQPHQVTQPTRVVIAGLQQEEMFLPVTNQNVLKWTISFQGIDYPMVAGKTVLLDIVRYLEKSQQYTAEEIKAKAHCQMENWIGKTIAIHATQETNRRTKQTYDCIRIYHGTINTQQ